MNRTGTRECASRYVVDEVSLDLEDDKSVNGMIDDKRISD